MAETQKSSSPEKEPMQTVPDTLTLDTIAQAAFVLRCFEKGITKEGLIRSLQGEISLAQAYFIFFKQMGWVMPNNHDVWFLTAKGKETLRGS